MSKKWIYIARGIGLYFILVSIYVLLALFYQLEYVKSYYAIFETPEKIILITTYMVYVLAIIAGILGFLLKEIGRKLMVLTEIVYLVNYFVQCLVLQDYFVILDVSALEVMRDIALALIFLYILTRPNLKAVYK